MTESFLTNSPVTGMDLVMQSLGNKVARGGTLTTAERLIPATAAANEAMRAYGGDIRHFEVTPPEIPEMVKL